MIAMAKKPHTRHYCHNCDNPAAYVLPVEDGDELGLCSSCFDDLLTRLESAREAFDAMEEQPYTFRTVASEISLIAAGVIFAMCVVTMALLGLLCWIF